ncbi:hypothetical protein, partial [uncultured Gammaproteobacteria bacterium]
WLSLEWIARVCCQVLLIARNQPNTNQLMFHSDQGVQYCANAFSQYC